MARPGRAAAAGHRAAAPVEERERDPVLAADARRRPPGPGRAPSWRPGSRRPCCCPSSRSSPSARRRRRPGGRGRPAARRARPGCAGAASRSSSVSKSGTIVRAPAAPPAQRASRSTVSMSAGAAGHRDDERSEQLGPVDGCARGRAAGRAARSPRSLLVGATRRGRPTAGGVVGQQRRSSRGARRVVAARRTPASRPSAGQEPASAAASRARVLPHVQAGRVEAEASIWAGRVPQRSPASARGTRPGDQVQRPAGPSARTRARCGVSSRSRAVMSSRDAASRSAASSESARR